MHQEHEAVGELLARIRTLTNDFVPPLAACATWKALYQGLEGLEAETHEHIHIENNILFPRAFASGIRSTDS
jgi:regulator of cell morphogenesis and NO signaling